MILVLIIFAKLPQFFRMVVFRDTLKNLKTCEFEVPKLNLF